MSIYVTAAAAAEAAKRIVAAAIATVAAMRAVDPQVSNAIPASIYTTVLRAILSATPV